MKVSYRQALLIAALVWAISVFFGLRYGSASLSELKWIWDLRLPRVILATAVGIGLTVAGIILQSVFSNPLCEPYTLGVSSGASLGAVIGSSLGWTWSYSGLAGSALVGGLIFLVILQGISLRLKSGSISLLLGGVMLGLLGSSLVALWMAFADANGMQSALFWLLGDFSRARLSGSLFTLGAVLILVAWIYHLRAELDAFLLGEEGAASLGVSVVRSQRRLVFLSAVLVALCVSAAGMIGFVGLVVPHFSRKICGSLHARLIPLACVVGAATLVFADAFSRAALSPYEIPVGVITSVVGVPIFIWMMSKELM